MDGLLLAGGVHVPLQHPQGHVAKVREAPGVWVEDGYLCVCKEDRGGWVGGWEAAIGKEDTHGHPSQPHPLLLLTLSSNMAHSSFSRGEP